FNTAAINVGALRAPNRFNTSIYNNDQRRFGGQVKAEYKSGDAYAFLSYYNYRQQESEYRWVDNFLLAAANITPTGPTTGSVSRAQHVTSLDWFPIMIGGSGYQGHFDSKVGDKGSVDLSAGWARQRFDHDTWGFAFQTPVSTALAFTFDAASLVPTRSGFATPSFLTNPANYSRNLINSRNLLTQEDVTNVKASYAWNEQGEGWGFKGGAEFRQLERLRDNDEFRFNSAVNFAPFLSSATQTYSEYGPEPFVFIDPNAVWNFFKSTPIPIDAARSISGDFTYQEDISALYGQASYTRDALRVVGGLRFEATDFEATASGQTRKTSGDYTHVLPSVVASYAFSDGLKLRAGYSQSLGRPNPSDLAITRTEVVDSGGVLNITQGNPNLQPREAKNYDLALEYYFMKGEGFLGGAVFHKDISGDIFTSQVTGAVNGQAARITQNVNARSSRVSGLELSAYMGKMPFLPAPWDGLGVSANATFTEGETEFLDGSKIDRRVRQTPFSGNLAAFFNWNGLEARIAYNYADKYLVLVDREEDAFEQVDASLRYRLTDRLTVGFEGRNLTDSVRTQIDNDNNFSTLFGETQLGRQYHVRLTYKH
ncbi:MAG: TonB-dependent receptor domain-containing protein, partial [Caulobacterales bacterium]